MVVKDGPFLILVFSIELLFRNSILLSWVIIGLWYGANKSDRIMFNVLFLDL